MSQYLLIKKLDVQNANAIAGLTYGFPAITNFLGFAHALSRKLSRELDVSLGGVCVVSHKNRVHARQPKGWGDYVFALTRNPLTQQGNTAPINEEGRMNLQVSLLIEIKGLIQGDNQTEQMLIDQINALLPAMRLAGGQITHYGQIEILSDHEQQQKALRRLMPGFILIDRSDYLASHVNGLQQEVVHGAKPSLFDAWCDFATLNYQATRLDTEPEISGPSDTIKADWHYVPKPQAGYLVPIATGYCAISPVYEAGQVANVRDKSVPVAFAETAYSVGEWLSIHRLIDISAGIWRYSYRHPWYLAKTEPFQVDIPSIADVDAALTSFNLDDY